MTNNLKNHKIRNLPKNWEIVSLKDNLELMTDYVANGSFESLRKRSSNILFAVTNVLLVPTVPPSVAPETPTYNAFADPMVIFWASCGNCISVQFVERG